MMARKPRIHVAGGLYHVMLRGNAKQDIFFSPADYHHMYALIEKGLEHFSHRVHAFCLMNNHIHLAIQVSDIPLSKIMQNLAFRYTRWINDKYKRSGHLFQGRYKALLVDEDSYLLELVRYIHLNPVRAGLVKHPGDYEWSGHRTYVGKQQLPWLTCDVVLSQFGRTIDAGREQYASFVMTALDEQFRLEFHKGSDDSRLLGDDFFLEQVLQKSAADVQVNISLEHLLALVSEMFDIEVVDLCSCSRKRHLSEARGVLVWLVSELRQHTLVELAMCMNRDPSTLSLQLKKTRQRMEKDALFLEKVNDMKNELLCNNSITHA